MYINEPMPIFYYNGILKSKKIYKIKHDNFCWLSHIKIEASDLIRVSLLNHNNDYLTCLYIPRGNTCSMSLGIIIDKYIYLKIEKGIKYKRYKDPLHYSINIFGERRINEN